MNAEARRTSTADIPGGLSQIYHYVSVHKNPCGVCVPRPAGIP